MPKLEVRCSDDLKEKLREAAAELEMSVSDYVRWILKESTKED